MESVMAGKLCSSFGVEELQIKFWCVKLGEFHWLNRQQDNKVFTLIQRLPALGKVLAASLVTKSLGN